MLSFLITHSAAHQVAVAGDGLGLGEPGVVAENFVFKNYQRKVRITLVPYFCLRFIEIRNMGMIISAAAYSKLCNYNRCLSPQLINLGALC